MSDKKIGVSSNGSTIDYYTADVLTASDYAPFGMQLVGRTYRANNSYRYGFNGKENDNEVKGEGNEQDYGLRIYDPRVGRFLSVDPLTKKYPELTPYQFASNTPIEAVDLDGAEKLDKIKKFETNGSITDNPVENIPNAIGNGVIDVLNLIPEVWNSGVDHYRALKRGTWLRDVGNEFKQTYNDFGKSVYDNIEYTLHTPIKKQLTDFGNTLNNPETLENAVATALSAKLISGAGNLMKVESFAQIMAKRRNLAASFYEQSGFTSAKAASHIEGINFNKAVQTTTLRKGTIIQQWVGENGVGNYFTTIENGSARNLGIGDYDTRQLKQFVLNEDVKVLKSTAAEYKGNAGGGTQLFSTALKNNITEIK